MKTFREWLREADLRDPDKYTSYDAFAMAQGTADERGLNKMSILLKKFKSKEKPIKVKYSGNTYAYFGQLFESKDKKLKVFLSSPISTDSYSSYELILSDAVRYPSFSETIKLGIDDFDKISSNSGINLIETKLKELYEKALKKFESKESFKKISDFKFKPDFMKYID